MAAIFVAATTLATPAGAGKGAFLPTYHAPPCAGAACRGDDPRSGLPCQGFLCSFTSAGAMQPPVTAAQAAEMEKARAAAADAAAVSAAQPAPVPTPLKKKPRPKAANAPSAPTARAATSAPPAAKPDRP